MRTPSPSSVLVALLAALGLAACGDSGPTTPDTQDPDTLGTSHPDPQPDPTSDVLCESLGYYCSVADVDDEVLARGDQVLAELKQRLDAGASTAEAATWLRAERDVREVGVVDEGIVFILRGGTPMFMMTPSTGGPAAAPPVITANAADVVGHGTPRDNPKKKKRALILSPFLFELGASGDPGERVGALLASSRDYQPGDDGAQRIRWITNADTPSVGSGRPTPDDFLGWDAYDFVMLHTHGAEFQDNPTLCQQLDPYFCVSGVMTGRRVTGCAQAKQLYPNYQGITCGGTRGADGFYVVLTTEFFDQAYNPLLGTAGLDKSIVIFSACHSSANGSLAAYVAGSRSEFFGWSRLADTGPASAAVTRLVELMVKDGLTSTKAFDKLKNEGRDRAGAARLEHRGNGDGLYIREITTLKNPVAGGASPAPGWASGHGPAAAPGDVELKGGDVLPFIGQAGDGNADELFFFVDVDGVESGRESAFSVRIDLDGQQLGTWSLEGQHARRIDDTTVRIRVHQPVSFDIQPGQSATLKAVTRLGDETESPHELQVTFENPKLRLRSTIRSAGGDASLESEVEGEVDLRFKRGDDPDELELDQSIGPLRYVRFDVTMQAPGCTISTITVPGRIGVPEAKIDFSDPTASDFGVPEELVLVVYPEIEETILIQCAQGSTSVPSIHWFAGFVSFHGGQLGGANELDTSKGGFVIRGWQPGSDGVYARKTYQRTGQEDDVSFEEDTTLEIGGPGYGSGPVSPGSGAGLTTPASAARR